MNETFFLYSPSLTDYFFVASTQVVAPVAAAEEEDLGAGLIAY